LVRTTLIDGPRPETGSGAAASPMLGWVLDARRCTRCSLVSSTPRVSSTLVVVDDGRLNAENPLRVRRFSESSTQVAVE